MKYSIPQSALGICHKNIHLTVINRLSRLSIVKKDKVRAIEDTLITAATSGKLPGRVSLNLFNFTSIHETIRVREPNLLMFWIEWNVAQLSL